MNVIHAFMLVLSMTGQPDKATAICDSYKKCFDEGAQIATQISSSDFSYRVIPVLIMPAPPTT
jgi:hypothetical protein